jgi:hypothetical protein
LAITAVLVAELSNQPQKVAVVEAVQEQLVVMLQVQVSQVMAATDSLTASQVHRSPALAVEGVAHRELLVLVVLVEAVQEQRQALQRTATQTQVVVVVVLRPTPQMAAMVAQEL